MQYKKNRKIPAVYKFICEKTGKSMVRLFLTAVNVPVCFPGHGKKRCYFAVTLSCCKKIQRELITVREPPRKIQFFARSAIFNA